MDFRLPDPKVIYRENNGNSGIEVLDNGAFFYVLKGERINWAHSKAQVIDGRKIDTRNAKLITHTKKEVCDEIGSGTLIKLQYHQNSLELVQLVTLYKDKDYITVKIDLKDLTKQTKTRFMAPFDTPYPDDSGKKLFLSLDQKMLLVPYDNDMWVRYESAVPRPGRTSYEITSIYNETSREGIVIGSLNHNTWKNAIIWSAFDARSITAISGVADHATHDSMPHGVVSGESVESSSFFIGWYDDIRKGLEEYGETIKSIYPLRRWSGTVPFCWNSFSGLGMGITIDHWKTAGDYIKEELKNYKDSDGVTYINLDASFNLDKEEISKTVDYFHKRGQKVGTYLGSFMWIERFANFPLKGVPGKTMGDLFLKDEQGNLFPAIDGLIPMDTTLPDWEVFVSKTIQEIVATGFDYLKIDFLSHGAIEAKRFDESITTGRMAISKAYQFLSRELSYEKLGKEIFVSLSIAPLFPNTFGNSRRYCCDAFGHIEDVRYCLNAVNFAWWVNGNLYNYNDPDHVVLYNSVIDKRGNTTIEEARSRYNSAIISGSVMMLSDNYGPIGDVDSINRVRSRSKEIADNERINAIGRLGKSFVPIELTDRTTNVYTLHHAGNYYAAIFNFKDVTDKITVDLQRGRLPLSGTAIDLNRDVSTSYKDELIVELKGYDSAIILLEP